MGVTSSSAARADAGEIVTVDPGPGRSPRQGGVDAKDPLLQRLALLESVPPILPPGDFSLAERLDGSASGGDDASAAGAAAAASLVRTLRSWSHEHTEGVSTTQEVLVARAQQTEAAAGGVLRKVLRAEAQTRALAADLQHVGALQQEIATVGAQLSAVLESYANLLRTFEQAVSRRKSVGSLTPGAAGSGTSLAPVSAGSSPRLGSRPGVGLPGTTAHPSPLGLASRMAGLVQHNDMPPLSLDGHAPGSLHPQPQGAARAAGAAHTGGGPIRVVSPRLMQPPEDGSHAASSSLPAGGLASTVHTRLPPLRVAAPGNMPGYAPPSPAPQQQQQPQGPPLGGGPASRLASPTTQSKRALFDAVAEAAATGTGLQGVVRAAPLSGFLSQQQPRRQGEAAAGHAGVSGPASSNLLLPGSPSRLRPVQSAGHGAFALEQPQPGSPGLLRLGPASSDALSSSPTGSLLRLDPFRASGGEAFLPPGGEDSRFFGQSPPMSASSHSSGPGSAVPGPPLALTPPVAPGSPRGPLRGMKWSTEGQHGSSSPTAGGRLQREVSPKRRLDMLAPASKAG